MRAHPSIPPEEMAKQPDFVCVVGRSIRAQAVLISQHLHGYINGTPI